jgi:hypothetical protein
MLFLQKNSLGFNGHGLFFCKCLAEKALPRHYLPEATGLIDPVYRILLFCGILAIFAQNFYILFYLFLFHQ